MQSDETKTIKASNIWGDPREYKFKLLDAPTGLRIFHQFATIIATSYDVLEGTIKKFFGELKVEVAEKEKEEKESELTVKDIIQILPRVFTWEVVAALSAEMLAGAEITANSKTETISNDGITPTCKGDPLEQYTALFFAICANYPKYVSFLGVALDESDSPAEAGALRTN